MKVSSLSITFLIIGTNDEILYDYLAHDGERFAIHKIHDTEDDIYL